MIGNSKAGLVGGLGIGQIASFLPTSTAAANVNTANAQAITFTAANSGGGTTISITTATIELID